MRRRGGADDVRMVDVTESTGTSRGHRGSTVAKRAVVEGVVVFLGKS